MEAWLQQWLSLLLRWAHFITGVAWIGASFYFNWLENHLERRVAGEDESDPIAGDLWAVHGGGFYYLQKFRVSPDRLPDTLHWFKYEAYFTWISGFALLAVVYYWNASIYMLDPAISAISPTQAVLLGVASLAASWLVYDGLCRSPLRHHPVGLSLMILGWFTLLAYVLSDFISGRAAYIHVGAAVGTVMVANVFFVIIPAQKDMVAALAEGRSADGSKGKNALLRSRHNNYLTLPVLFIMMSNHYPASYGNEYNWQILLVFSLAAVGIRHWFNVRHLADYNRWILPLSVILMLALIYSTMPARQGSNSDLGLTAPSTADIMPLIQEHCVSCHASNPSFSGFAAPPLGLSFEQEQQVETQAERIHRVVVTTRTMPLGNLTAMSEDERVKLAQWYAARLP
jgi:uncharacterized membrane protein